PPKDPAPISPSRDGAAFLSQVAPAPSPQDPEAARLAGIALHTLLEHLPTVPPQDRPRLAQTLLEALPEAPPPEAHPALITRATALITQPDLAWIFAPDTLTEVPVAGRVAALNNQKLSGKIDRLVIQPDTVWIIDYKSNAVPEDPLPRSIAGQLALYVIPLQQIFPKHQIRACVLWTATGGLTELHHVTVKEVLQSATPH
ncbi:MAG: PD-(D/E)XK nuclease family protein, partial [Pseudomonadota bacterium]